MGSKLVRLGFALVADGLIKVPPFERCFAFQRLTTIVFMGILAAFEFVDKFASLHCLLRIGVPEKYVLVIQELYGHTSGRIEVYCQL